jgi:hypothetical protein
VNYGRVIADPSEIPEQQRHLSRTKSQEIAWVIVVLALLIGLVVLLGPKIRGDETTNREYLVILLLGVTAVVFGLIVVERLWLQAGKKLAPLKTLPWRESLRTEAALHRLGASWTQSTGRLHLPEVGLQGTSLPAVDLRAADLTEASLRNANLSGANLQHADLTAADLRGADLRRGNLAWSTLVGATLEGARLDRVNLFGADLRGAELQDAKFTGALYDLETRWPKEFSPVAAGAEWVDRRDPDA